VYTSAEFVGLAFLTPLLAWLKVTFGWPAIFFFTGALGLAWSFVFRRGAYHDPAEFPGANRAEVVLIRSSCGIPDLSSRITARHAARDGSLWKLGTSNNPTVMRRMISMTRPVESPRQSVAIDQKKMVSG
jgi:ACS family D-galactonate transporter-like MFS transporter